jgi:hypothetical protein
MATRAFSVEAGNLASSLVSSRAIDYKDIDLSFTRNTINDIYKKIDAEAVKQSVKNIILTNLGEKPFQPSFGTQIRDLLFELASDPFIKSDIRDRISQSITRFEPRALIESIKVYLNPDSNILAVDIIFQVVNTDETVNLNVTLSRLR